MRRFLPTGCPQHTQWGQVDQARQIADGWWSVCTPSHGGFVLSAERWMRMPKYMQATTYSQGGQFEEDCDWCLPAVFFHTEYQSHLRDEENRRNYPDGYDPVQAAWSTFKRWHPEKHAQYAAETHITDMNSRGVFFDMTACAAAR